MAVVSKIDGSQVRGKLNKKSKEVHRIRNGREYVHTIENKYEGPASKAQKLQRSIFGKTNAILNSIMADPEQVKLWQEKLDEYNRNFDWTQRPIQPRFTTVRSYAYSVISQQLKNKPASRRRKADLPFVLPKGVRLQVKLFSDLSATELYEILKARFAVFVGEQHIHYLDEDNIDYVATHFAIRKKGLVLAYARLFPDAEEGVLRIGRMLTMERKQGYAKYLMTQIIAEARKKGAHTLRLHAQTQVVPFYEYLGFKTVGDVFIEADLTHITMELPL